MLDAGRAAGARGFLLTSWGDHGATPAHVSVNNFASLLWAEMFPTIDSGRAMQAMAAGAVVACVLVLWGDPRAARLSGARPGDRDHAVLVRPDDRLQPGLHAEFGQHPGQVRLHGRQLDHEGAGDLVVRHALGE